MTKFLESLLANQEIAKFSKLPKWAQEKFHFLATRINTLQDSLNEKNEKTSIYIGDDRAKRYLDPHSSIYIEGTDGTFTISLQEGKLVISSHGGDRLAVLPGATNSIKLAIMARNYEKSGPEFTIGYKA